MPPPSQLSIATSAVTRLLKEETTYRRELEGQEKRLRQMQEADNDDENRDFNLKQEVSLPTLFTCIPFSKSNLVSSTKRIRDAGWENPLNRGSQCGKKGHQHV